MKLSYCEDLENSLLEVIFIEKACGSLSGAGGSCFGRSMSEEGSEWVAFRLPLDHDNPDEYVLYAIGSKCPPIGSLYYKPSFTNHYVRTFCSIPLGLLLDLQMCFRCEVDLAQMI